MKAAIYVRVSTERQAAAGHVSLDVQERRCREFVEQKGGSVVAVECDHESGMKVTRAGYQRILEMARQGKITDVIVYSASRFGRRASEVLSRIEELRSEHGVELHSTEEDLSNFLLTGITAVINEETSRTIARLAAPAKLHRARDGYWLAHAPFGTRNAHGVLEPSEEIDILRGMFERAAAGASVRQVTLWVNSLRSSPLTREGVREILRNDAYIGKTRWAQQKFEGRWEPFVDVALWKRAQHAVRHRVNERAAVDRQRPHWILGLAFCGRCGHRMSRRIAIKTWGTRYEYLACNRKDPVAVMVGCGSPHLPIRKVQGEVLEQLRALRLDGPALDAFCKQLADDGERGSDEDRARREGMVAERRRLMQRRMKAQQAYMDDVYDKTEYQRATNGLSDAIAAIDEQLEETTSSASVNVDAVRMLLGGDAWLSLAEEAPLEFREFLRFFVERIDVGPLRITWRVAVTPAVRV